MDLFSQAEHDELAQSILYCVLTQIILIVFTPVSIASLKPCRARRSLHFTRDRGALIKVKDMHEACAIANDIAAEHEISATEPRLWQITCHAGAMFLGRFSSESLGDYCAGPNHVLPTSRTARSLHLWAFMISKKRSSMIEVSEGGAQSFGEIAAELAYGEGLPAHARSAELRLKS